ncbi:MAG: hypothetical protein PHC53_02610 [Patescibacteria group bacterium]|nr:hypothetical protein [Patescibacteria group bacterium]
MPKKKPSVKKKKVRKVEVAAVPNGNLLPLNETSPDEIVSDLQCLVASAGWKRLKQFIQRQVDEWTERVDNEEFTDMHVFNQVRAERNIYRSLLSLPERHIRLILEKPQAENLDPYPT